MILAVNAETVGIFAVPNATTAFGKVKPVGTIIFNVSTGGLSKLTAKAGASDTLSTASVSEVGGYSGGDIELGDSDSLAFGGITIDNTWRIKRAGTDLVFEKRESGVYVEKSRIQNSLYIDHIHLNEDLTLTAAGHHLRIASNGMTEGQEAALLIQAPYGPTTGTTAPLVPILEPLENNVIMQPDDSGEFTGQTFGFGAEFPYGQIVNNLYFKTGATAATDFITVKFYFGADSSGDLFYENKMRADAFPANSTIEIDIEDVLGLPGNTQMYAELTSPANFSFKTSASGDDLWFSLDRYKGTHESIAYAPGWSAKTWTVDDQIVDGGLFYICNTTGDQTSDFATNSALWDVLGSEAATKLWDRNGTDLITENTGDSVILGGNLIIDTDTLYVNSTNNRVSVGTAIPASIFHVYENNTASGDGAGATIEQDGAGDSMLHFYLTDEHRWAMGSDNNDSNKFKIASSENLNSQTRFTILDGGKIGIGTDSPAELLDVSNTGGIASLRIAGSGANVKHTVNVEYDINYTRDAGLATLDLRALSADGTSNSFYRFGLASGSSGNQFIYLYEPNGSDVSARIATGTQDSYINVAGGNFGIGTDSPVANLHIEDTSTDATLRIGEYLMYGNLYWDISDSQFVLSAVNNDFPVRIEGSHIYLMPVGNVGIGVIDPDTELEINGGIHISDLEGSYTGGSAYACVYDSGVLYASESACP